VSVEPFVSLTVDGVREPVRVLEMRGVERISRPSSWVLSCAAERAGQGPLHDDPTSLVTRTAELEWALTQGGTRVRRGLLVDAVETFDGRIRWSLVSRGALCADGCDHRVFVDRDAVEIAVAVLGEQGIQTETRVERTLPKLSQSIQKFESDLAYVDRLLATEGVAYFENDDGAWVLTDNAEGFDRLTGTLPAVETAGLRGREAVFETRLELQRTTDATALRDYDFEKPLLDLNASAGDGALCVYSYPGGFADSGVGGVLARIRLEEKRMLARVLRGAASARTLRAGTIVELSGGDVDGVAGRWLLVEVIHHAKDAAGGEMPFVSRFLAVPADGGFRPRRVREPRVGGVQTAVVTGPAGSEIHTEQHARVRVHHRWDRLGPLDDRSSQWARVVQPPTSGSIFVPRVGWEALLAFGGRDGDEPVLVGQLYNGVSRPPSGLPAGKVESAFGTRSTPGGGGANVLKVSDTAGGEVMALEASKDFNEKTENDKVTAVVGDNTWSVASRTLTVGQVLSRGVTGAQQHNVLGMRSATVGANFSYTAADELAVVAGLRVIRTGGDLSNSSSLWIRIVAGAEGQLCIEHYNRFVVGSSVTFTGGSWATVAGLAASTNVGGVSLRRVGGPMSIKCVNYAQSSMAILSEKYASRTVVAGGFVHDKLKGAAKYTISGDATFKGANVYFEASSKLTVKAGGITITLTPDNIKVAGKFIGSVASDEGNNSCFGG